MIDQKYKIKNLDEASLAIMAQGFVLAQIAQTGEVDIEAVRQSVLAACENDINEVAVAMGHAQRAAGLTT
ncbi:hypothetical protein QTO30_20780 [Yoonia sp. GPGPB17]|uniref:hypothetical protein n=1 Tax=Yoonia sp. GPGPB17 TaxID=3026147 RepID=UPI0030C12CB8